MLNTAPVSVVLPVIDFKKAMAFYRDTLGLKLGSESEGMATFVAGEGTEITIFESDSRKSEDTAAAFDVKDLAAEMKALRAKGVVFEDYDLPGIKTVDGVCTMGKMSCAWFKDPGGNILALNQY